MEKQIVASMKQESYNKDISLVEKELETNIDKGLTNEEVNSRIEKYGKNELIKAKKKPLILKFLAQFNNFMIYVLLAAALVNFVVNIIEIKTSETGGSLDVDPFLILGIVILNAIIGVIQEAKADKALESIKALSSPHAKVLREGKETLIDVKDIVVGDIVILDAGDYVPADLRLIESVSLKIDESALTGESVPVEKDCVTIKKQVPLGDRINLAFMSTVVTYGRGMGIVVATAMDTQIGHIASLLSEQENETTPLQKNIAQLGKILALICLAIVVLIFIIQIVESSITHPDVLKTSGFWIESMLVSIALAVAAIPEGLPAIITIVLALGMQNLVKHKAIMKTLPAVETLGSTSIICSDKTGTLTQNKMDVLKVYTNKTIIDINNDTVLDDTTKTLINYGILNNDTKTSITEDKYVKIGDPTEIAFIDLAIKFNINPVDYFKENPRLFEFPFDSDRKMMTTFHKFGNKIVAIVKGAPDIVFSRSIHEVVDDKVVKLESCAHYEQTNLELANKALRVLAIAYKEYDVNTNLKDLKMEDVEKDLTLLGLVGMMDPARPEVKDAIVLCKQAGISTIMITGDHKNTAMAIAKELNILEKGQLAISGAELDKLSDEEFKEKLRDIRVYARVSPENKVRIVSAWKETGLVVAMTGDGVNDAPSIKKADIGIAMGITGTEVAKGAADMILTDDNFTTIVNAVGEGRTIFANIKKAIHYLLSCNVGEILTVLLGTTLAIWVLGTTVTTLTAAQLLWVNIVTDSLMAISLGLELKERNVMSKKPRDTKKSIFAGGLGVNIFIQGIILGVCCFAAYVIGYKMGEARTSDAGIAESEGETLCFMVLAISQLFHAFNCRSEEESIFRLKPNWWLIGSFVICLGLQFLTVLPGIRDVFNVTMPSWDEWLIILGFCLVLVCLIEIQKLIRRIINRKKQRNK